MLEQLLEKINTKFIGTEKCTVPTYSPISHVSDLATNKYWNRILHLRHILKISSEHFFCYEKNGINIDLFMLTPSVSSPMGPGSDSEAIPIKFGTLETFLVDSSQFGFEPILMNDIDLAYCYLPSMRGEDPDKRHLNQFYHCEAEINGGFEEIINLVEEYIKYISLSMTQVPELINTISLSPKTSKNALSLINESESFKRITFDDAVKLLEENNFENYINYTEHGRDINSFGEIELSKIFSPDMPFWITHFDRDRVPFYQKPNPENTNTVLNADLIFPPLIEDSFGGEVIGCGERQNLASEIIESINKQGLNHSPYDWYTNLRNLENYSTTSGFGMGVERYLAWLLCLDDIKNTIPYPRLKNILTHP